MQQCCGQAADACAAPRTWLHVHSGGDGRCAFGERLAGLRESPDPGGQVQFTALRPKQGGDGAVWRAGDRYPAPRPAPTTRLALGAS